jgi:hypothetical protein
MVLPMSDLELRLARALDRCDLKQGSTDKRFCANLSTRSRHQNQILLTEGQRAYLWRIAYRYRHLLAGDLASKAETKAGTVATSGRKHAKKALGKRHEAAAASPSLQVTSPRVHCLGGLMCLTGARQPFIAEWRRPPQRSACCP